MSHLGTPHPAYLRWCRVVLHVKSRCTTPPFVRWPARWLRDGKAEGTDGTELLAYMHMHMHMRGEGHVLDSIRDFA